jgi:uncharacterized membrane protein YeaQ/YmgE (transglycosylase-associated protein family)
MDYLFLILTIPAYVLCVVLWKTRVRLKRINEYKSYTFVAINVFLGILGALIASFQTLFLEKHLSIENGFTFSIMIMGAVVALLYYFFVASNKKIEA